MKQLKGIPLSRQQKQIFSQEKNNNKRFSNSCRIRITGPLDTEKMKFAIGELIRRHEIFRTEIGLVDGTAINQQIVRSEILFDWTVEYATECQPLFSYNLISPNNILNARLMVIKSNELYDLYLTIPRMLSDVLTLNNVYREVVALYCGEPVISDSEIVQYVDFSQWQDEVVAEDIEAQDFWRSQIAKNIQPMKLPGELDRASSALHSEILIHSDCSQPVKRERILALWVTLLKRLSGDETVVLGLAMNGRLSEEFSFGMGAYSRSLPYQFRVSDQATLADIESVAGDVLDELFAQQMSYPIAYDFQRAHIGFIYEEMTGALSGSHDTRFEMEDCVFDTGVNKLQLTCLEKGNKQLIKLHYDSDIYSQEFIQSIAEMLSTMLMIDDFSQENRDIPLMDVDTALAYYDSFNFVNGTGVINFVEQFEISAERYPDIVAVAAGSEYLSYKTLNQRANALAHNLASMNIRRGQFVAVCMSRSIDMLTSLLGVLKSGAAYIAIDPAIPSERKSIMTEHASLLISDADYDIPGYNGACLSAADVCRLEKNTNLGLDIGDQDIAYVLFTSGSTGKPKGVLVPHLGLGNYLQWASNCYLPAAMGSVVHSSIGFDLTVTSLFGPLTKGKKVTLTPDQDGLEGLQRALLDEAAPLMLKVTPAHLKALRPWLENLQAGQVNLVCLIVGGEALSENDVAVCFEKFPSIKIYNEYGPTETTVGCCVYEVTRSDLGNIPIGLPIASTSQYVLDENGEIVAPGHIGELYIGGYGVASGYLDMVEVTAERFVNPGFKTPCKLLYKTGDIVRLNLGKESYYEYLGRNDRQVKINGYRIELGEIEASIKALVSCDDAIVVTKKNNFNENELVAYVKSANAIEMVDFESQLNGRLPNYMIPSVLIVQKDFPLTTNGKVDILALERMEIRNVNAQPYVAPRSDLEHALVDIWQAALNVEKVGVKDNFFNLGGDSIRGVHVVALGREAGLEYSIQNLFDAGTVEHLALLIEKQNTTVGESSGPEYLKSLPPFSIISSEDKNKMSERIVDAFPLGTVQLGMTYQMMRNREANTPADYHNVASFVLRVDHNFDISTFQAAVDEVVRHEPYLRTYFDLTGYKEPLQLVQDTAELKVQFEDLRGLSEAGKDEVLRNFVQAENFNIIDYSMAPLMRLRVHLLADDVISLSLTEPHALADGWSTHLTLIDIFKAYFALLDNVPHNLKMVNTSYSEFIALERKIIHSDDAKAFWKKKIERCVSLDFPPRDIETNEVQHLGDHRHRIEIPTSISKGLEAVARRAGTPLKSVLLAAHCRLLSLITGEKTITTGLNFNGRLEATDGIHMRGLFLNMLPVTLDLSGGKWLDLIRAAYEAEKEILPYRRYPLGLLLSEHRKDKLFDSALSFLHFHSLRTETKEESKRIESIKTIDYSKTNYDFNAVFDRNPFDEEGLTYIGDANLDRFSRKQLDRFLGYYLAILEDIAHNSEQDYLRTDLLPNSEKDRVLRLWNSSHAENAGLTVLDHFEQHAVNNPQAVALHLNDGKYLSYSELNSKANRFAHSLTDKGISEGEIIGVYLPRSENVVAALLGIMKAGATYLPMDVDYPVGRLAHTLQESRVTKVISHQALPEEFGADIELLNPEHLDSYHLSENLQHKPQLTDVAYVLYTSGSTGKPKGVLINHSALNNYVVWAKKTYLGDTPKCFAFYTSLAFDLTVTSIFSPLISGGSIRIYDQGEAISTIGHIVSENLVDVVKLTPAHLSLLKHIDISDWNATCLIVGGEQLQGSLAHYISDQMGHKVAIYNEYGPTETTVGCTAHKFVPGVDSKGAVPIGLPTDNTQIYVLDNKGKPLPIGVKGELYIAGAGVADGYIARPEITNERFIPNPFGSGNMYRTGDVARWRSDGILEYIGRQDSQIKIRGYRIEIGEIESQLNLIDFVHQAVIDVRGEGDNRQIYAYVELKEKVAVDEAERGIRGALVKQLPEYMCPAAYVFVDALPLTTNGKIDRIKLLELVPGRTAERQIVLPTTELQKKLCAIWREVLNLEQVGVHDVFFEIGGHSIQALYLITSIQSNLNISLSLTEFLENPTVAQLEVLIEAGKKEGPDEQPVAFEELPSIHTHSDHHFELFPLTKVQQAYIMGRSTAFDLGNVATHAYLESNWQDLDVEKLNTVVNRLIQRHGMLRGVISENGEQRILHSVPEYKIQFNDVSAEEVSVRDQSLMAIRKEISHQVIPLDHWPMFDLRITKFDGSRYRLHISVDALIFDAMSFDIISEELTRLYIDPTVELPPIGISFRDYVLAEIELKKSQRYEAARQYWLNRIITLPRSPDLPLAVNPQDIDRPVFERHDTRIAADKWSAIKIMAQKLQVTPTILILTVFSMVLRKWSKNSSFTLNLTLFNRLPLHEDVNLLVGDFTSLTLLEIDLENGCDLASASKKIQVRLWRDLENRLFGGMEVLRAINADEGRIQSGSFPVVFSSTLGLRDVREDVVAIQNAEHEFAITQTPQVWIDHQVAELDGELHLSWDTIDGLFPEGMIDDMFTCYQQILDGLADDTFNPIVNIDLPVWQQRFIENYNATENDFFFAQKSTTYLHSAFREIVAVNPKSVAVVSGTIRLSYQQLDQIALGIAEQLIQQGVQPNQLVAVVMEKGWQQIAAVLGILYAGGAYLPVDGRAPDKRIEQLLELGEVRVALIQESLYESLCWMKEKVTVIIADDYLNTVGVDYSSLAVARSVLDLAYVIFTSGSTGKPKGVMIDHESVVNTIVDINTRFDVGSNDKVLAISALNFDLSVYDIFGLLSVGGCIVIPEAALERDPIHWLSLVGTEKITIWNTVPALAQLLVDEAYESLSGDRDISSLRLMLNSGDWIPLDLPQKLTSINDRTRFVSLGGATEASIWSIFFDVANGVAADWKSIPYGKPLANQKFYVLDDTLKHRPIYAVGDLYIGGVGLANGYWKAPETTAASFISHPLTGEKLYKTGDLGRYLSNGEIEFLGREDSQVKLNGYRVELGEIEATINQHLGVKASAVVVQESNGKQKRLIAYIVPQKKSVEFEGGLAGIESHQQWPTELNKNGLQDTYKEQLSVHLPHYMVPEIFIEIEKLPLSANGKIDKKALPKPDFDNQLSHQYVAPRNAVESILCEIWQEVLSRDQIGIYDNFFRSGGDSLMSIRVSTKAAKLGLKFSIMDLHNNPTVADLSPLVKVDQLIDDSGAQLLVVGGVPLSSAQQWFFDAIKVNPGRGDISIVFELASIDIEIFKQTLWLLFKHHDALRAKFLSHGGAWSQILVAPEEVNIFVDEYDLSSFSVMEQIEYIDHLRINALQSGMSLSQAPLINTQVFSRGKDKGYILRLSIHHLLVDGFSMSVIKEDFQKCYLALSLGQEYQFPQKTLSVSEWQTMLIAHANSISMSNQINYWLTQPWNRIKPIPVDFISDNDKQKLGGFITIENHLSTNETLMLQQSVLNTLKIPIIDILIGAVAQAMASTNGEIYQLLKVVDSGRNLGLDADLSRTVGWIAISRILLLAVEKDQFVSASAMHKIHEQIQQIPDRGLGFELLNCYHRDSGVREKMRALPKPEILINYHGIITSENNSSAFVEDYLSRETKLTQFDPNNETHEKLICNASIMNGELILSWQYSRYWHSEKTIKTFISDVLERVENIVCLLPEVEL